MVIAVKLRWLSLLLLAMLLARYQEYNERVLPNVSYIWHSNGYQVRRKSAALQLRRSRRPRAKLRKEEQLPALVQLSHGDAKQKPSHIDGFIVHGYAALWFRQVCHLDV